MISIKDEIEKAPHIQLYRVFSLGREFRYEDAIRLKSELNGQGKRFSAGETAGGLGVSFNAEDLFYLIKMAEKYNTSLDEEAFSEKFKKAWRDEHKKK